MISTFSTSSYGWCPLWLKTKKFLKKTLVTRERECVSLYCNRNRYIIYPKLNYSQVKCPQILRFDCFTCLFKLQLLFWCQASVLHLALSPLAIYYTVIGTQAIFRMLFHSWCWITLQHLQNASQTCHIPSCLFFPPYYHPCCPYENHLADNIPGLLKLKSACAYGQDRLSISFVVQGVRIPSEDFMERSSLKPHCHARH